jgi:hypothetical protein
MESPATANPLPIHCIDEALEHKQIERARTLRKRSDKLNYFGKLTTAW